MVTMLERRCVPITSHFARVTSNAQASAAATNHVCGCLFKSVCQIFMPTYYYVGQSNFAVDPGPRLCRCNGRGEQLCSCHGRVWVWPNTHDCYHLNDPQPPFSRCTCCSRCRPACTQGKVTKSGSITCAYLFAAIPLPGAPCFPMPSHVHLAAGSLRAHPRSFAILVASDTIRQPA
jgi:hypothetical protein